MRMRTEHPGKRDAKLKRDHRIGDIDTGATVIVPAQAAMMETADLLSKTQWTEARIDGKADDDGKLLSTGSRAIQVI